MKVFAKLADIIGTIAMLAVLAATTVTTVRLPVDIAHGMQDTQGVTVLSSMAAFIAMLACWSSILSLVADWVLTRVFNSRGIDVVVALQLIYWPALGAMIFFALHSTDLAASPFDVLTAFFEAAAADPARITIDLLGTITFQAISIWMAWPSTSADAR